MFRFVIVSLLLSWEYAADASAASGVVSNYVYRQEALAWLRLHIVPATWTDAVLRCQYEGGILASPTTEGMARAMQAAITEIRKPITKVFIGITDQLSKGEFRSLEGMTLSNIPPQWAANEPTNTDDAEHCLALTNAGTLADVSCSRVLPYLCRKHAACDAERTPQCNSSNGYEWEPRTGSCYKFHRVSKTWLPALAACHAEGGHLAIVNSGVEATVLKELFGSNPTNTIVGANWPYAIVGFRKWDKSGKWATLHGESLSEAGYERWAQGEPNSSGGKEPEDCGTIDREGLFNDSPCEEPYPYICEITH